MRDDDFDLCAEIGDALSADLDAPPESLHAWIERTAPAQAPIPWHLAQLVALFQRAMHERVFALVSMPPRHAKSTTVRRALAYSIRQHPDRLCGFVTYATGYARTHSRAIRKLVVQQGGRLATDGGANVDNWRTPEEGGLSVTGRDGQLTGKGFGGLLVADDLIKNRAEAESVASRDKLSESFDQDLFTRSEPPFGSIVVVATRWHEDDQTGRLERERDEHGKPVWEVLNLPALRDPRTGEPSDADDAIALWPERYPVEALRKIRRKLGPYGWWSLYQGRPRPRDGKVFRVAQRYTQRPGFGRHVLAVDPAGSSKTRANHTVAVALWVVGSGAQMRAWLVGLLRLQLEPPQAAAELLAFQRRFGATLHIENTRDGAAQAKTLRELAPELSVELVTALGDKYTRAQPLAAAWNGDLERGEEPRFFVPAEAELIGCTREDLANYLRVVEKFTGLGDLEDDDVDATAHAWNRAAETAAEIIVPPRPRGGVGPRPRM